MKKTSELFEGPDSSLRKAFDEATQEEWKDRQKCNGMHCKCMNLAGQCPNMHYAECSEHNPTIGGIQCPAKQPAPQEQEDTLDTLVRDLTTVHPMPKSEVRRRLSDFIERAKAEERDRIRGYALSNMTEPRYGMDTKWGDTDHPHPSVVYGMNDQLQHLIDFLDNHPQENEKSNTGKPAR